jgi:hypothetical protein
MQTKTIRAYNVNKLFDSSPLSCFPLMIKRNTCTFMYKFGVNIYHLYVLVLITVNEKRFRSISSSQFEFCITLNKILYLLVYRWLHYNNTYLFIITAQNYLQLAPAFHRDCEWCAWHEPLALFLGACPTFGAYGWFLSFLIIHRR